MNAFDPADRNPHEELMNPQVQENGIQIGALADGDRLR